MKLANVHPLVVLQLAGAARQEANTRRVSVLDDKFQGAVVRPDDHALLEMAPIFRVVEFFGRNLKHLSRLYWQGGGKVFRPHLVAGKVDQDVGVRHLGADFADCRVDFVNTAVSAIDAIDVFWRMNARQRHPMQKRWAGCQYVTLHGHKSPWYNNDVAAIDHKTQPDF